MFCDKGAVPLKIEQGTLSHQAKVMQKCILQVRQHFEGKTNYFIYKATYSNNLLFR